MAGSMGQAMSYNNEIQKEEQQREYKSEREKYNKYLKNKKLNEKNAKDRLEVLSKVRLGILGNSFYKGQKKILENNPNSAPQVLNELQRRLNEKYSGEPEGNKATTKSNTTTSTNCGL
jgi:hypothetical protein